MNDAHLQIDSILMTTSFESRNSREKLAETGRIHHEQKKERNNSYCNPSSVREIHRDRCIFEKDVEDRFDYDRCDCYWHRHSINDPLKEKKGTWLENKSIEQFSSLIF